MSDAGARASAYDATVLAEDGPAAERARLKRLAAIGYAERMVESAQDALGRVEGKAAKFDEAARLVRDVEVPEAVQAIAAAEAELAQAREAAEVD
jgi:hypothetical protein